MDCLIVDTNIIGKICNPINDDNIRGLIEWLELDGVLEVSHKLMLEYVGTAGSAKPDNTWAVLMQKLISTGRWKNYSNKDIRKVVFKPKDQKKFRSSLKDRDHIRLAIISHSKTFLTEDGPFRDDLNGYKPVDLRGVKDFSDL